MFATYHVLLSNLPSFWFDPKMLSMYGCGITRVNSLYVAARTASPSTATKILAGLEGLKLSKYYICFNNIR